MMSEHLLTRLWTRYRIKLLLNSLNYKVLSLEKDYIHFKFLRKNL